MVVKAVYRCSFCGRRLFVSTSVNPHRSLALIVEAIAENSKAKSGEIVFVSPKIILTECIGQKTVNNTPIYLVKGNIDQTRKV